MNSRTTLFALFAAMGLTGLGLVALVAASLRIHMYVPGFMFIAVGGFVAARAASHAATFATSSQSRNRALTTLAWAALAQGYPERAKAALDQIEPAHALDVHCFAAVEAVRGRTRLAINALETLRTAGALNREAAKLLVECYLRVFGMEQAVSMAFKTRVILGRENCEIVLKAARTSGANAAADSLAEAIRKRSDGGESLAKSHILPSQA